MSIEVATYIADLQPVNPPSTDPRGQGDDHLRLIKQVLQNQFSGASRAFQIPSTLAKSANYSVVKADGESVIYVNTSGGAVTLTLPSLVAGDQGWKVTFIKTTSDANPMFIAPAAGTLNSGGVASLSKARRCIPGVNVSAVWDGSNWFVTRALAMPIGSMVDFAGSSLPAGFEWPNGQTLSSSANYPEYNSAMGGLTTLDMRGRVAVTLDNLGGSAAGRLAGGIITGTAVGNVGGADTVTLNTTQIPAHTHANTLSDPGHTHTAKDFGGTGSSPFPTLATNAVGSPPPTYQTLSSVTGITINNASAGGGAAHSNLQPSIMCSKILVVE